LWDRVYQSWMSSDDTNGPKVTQDAVRISWENFMSDIQRSPEMFNLNGIVDFAKQNVGTLLSLLESVWSIVKGNIGLVLGSFSAFLSVILGGGTAVLNFILNGIVFLTTLFYLLSCSGDLYKPVEFMTNFSSSGRRFGHALEGAVNGVFTASFKMAAFYGLWTWFIHNLFGVKIVYLPSAFAMILGAVPFLGTYWACCPAVLDLWLAQDRGIEAILFAVFQFLPTSIVDTTIYKEIKG
jgi:predicted PurR-regulated permease PerM